ncbi:hypothetical protein UlMin_004951, partial [Ulmus minor]
MEKQESRRRSLDRKKRKAKADASSNCNNGDSNFVFAVLLASICGFHEQPILLRPLIKNCLNKLCLCLKQNLPINPILSLLPTLLGSKCAGIASRAAEIVGKASLLSLEMNEQIAKDGETLKTLVSALANRKRRVSLAACNAVLDLCTTSIGRQSLLDFSTLEALIVGFLQVTKSSRTTVSLYSVSVYDQSVTCLDMGFREDELPVLLLNVAINLINTCNIQQLVKIPRDTSEALLNLLNKLWAQVCCQIGFHISMKCSEEGHFNVSDIKIKDLAESIFRLSTNVDQLFTPLKLEVVKGSIFGCIDSGFEDFILHQWEALPCLVRRLSGASFERDDIFSLFLQSLNSTQTYPSFLSSMLGNMVSCPPIASDEFDILGFLKEARCTLGCPLIYGDDIRVLRTERHSNSEKHFFHFASDSKSSRVLNIDDTLKCEEAYKEGYTVALRGMEFRFAHIAAIADGLASLFGQPSVGANMYLTPQNSQGLACHSDDHCVFVCQLFGTKQWKVFSQPNVQLPRLYDPLNSLHSEADSSEAGYRLFSLREGDILYIPRGFPHEAYTHSGGDSAGFSLHITLGIEVEPPFEWEGFVHLALSVWNTRHKQPCYASDCSSGIFWDISMVLLHLAIGLIGNSDPTFRKACLVAANSASSNSNDWIALNQRTIFCSLIDKINTESKFLEALRSLEVAIEKNEDPLDRIKWLWSFNLGDKSIDGHSWNRPLVETENLCKSLIQYKCEIEASFIKVKSRFCCEVLFDDVKPSYTMLLEKYRK